MTKLHTRDRDGVGRRSHLAGRARIAAVAAAGFLLVPAAALASAPESSPDTTPPASSGAPVTGGGLEGVTWDVDSASLDVSAAGDVVPTLHLEDGTVTGFSGCNTFHGTYTTDGTSLTFGMLGTTMMACEAPASTVESELLHRLEETTSFTIGVSGLELLDASGKAVVHANVSNSSLVGDWAITGYLNADANGFMSVLEGDAAPTASFAEDGTVSGNAGCNTYNGPWTQSGDRTDISVGPLATTRMACADQDANDQETSLLQALEASVSADVTTHAATFYNDDGWRTATLTR
jgi:heat shock protein HslJ